MARVLRWQSFAEPNIMNNDKSPEYCEITDIRGILLIFQLTTGWFAAYNHSM